MATVRPRPRASHAMVLFTLLTLNVAFVALAQVPDAVPAPAQIPEMVPAPQVGARFGVTVGDFNNGQVRGAIVVGVFPNTPATRVRVKRMGPNGSVVLGQPTTMIQGDIITGLREEGEAWSPIQGVQDLVVAIGNLQAGAEFEIRGYDAGNNYQRFVAVARLPMGGGGGGVPQAESGRVRALLIADTNSGLLGLEQDLATIRSLLEPLRQEGRCSIESLTGAAVRDRRILDWLKNQGNASGDTIFVYYSGHGATDPNADPQPAQGTNGHYLALTNSQPLFRSTLREALAQRTPRLTVLLTDCCSNVVPVAPAPAPPMMNPRLARSLFLRTRGVVDITGATFDPQTGVDESAWSGPAGGYFTLSLGSILLGQAFEKLDANPRDNLVTWREIFFAVRQTTDTEYRELRTAVLNMPNRYKPETVAACKRQPHQRPWEFSLDHP